MARLHRSVATLRISGDELIPSEISSMLGAEPTVARLKGQEIRLRSGGTRIALTGQWHLHTSDTEPEDLDGQVAELLGRLTCDLSVWADLSSRFNVDLFCGWFMQQGNEGVEISPATLKALGERGIILGLDIYGPEA